MNDGQRAEMPYCSVTGPEGSFIPFQLTFNSLGSAFIGQALQIRLSSSQAQSAFDAIQLDGVGPTIVPEPSTAALLLGGALLWKGTRRFG